ncbi:MAG: efflux RND transporter periplasmic adaptor subunit [Thermodesulfobacteriota bacterium]
MNDIPAPGTRQPASLEQLLDTRAGKRFGRRGLWLAGALTLIVGAVLLFFLLSDDNATADRYKTEAVETGTLVVKVSATGNLQPTNQVKVGSELSGIIEQVFVDDNDRVEKGQELARLDLSKLRDAVARSRAALASAEAGVLQARATVAEKQAGLARLREVSRISGGKVPSAEEMDMAEADVKRAEADEAAALAAVAQAGATLQSGETDLAKASIRSPINGVVLSREVEPGQTVAASFQAPVLFTLAEDLTRMELQVDIDEADVGQVREGQQATFSVDAWPGRQYTAVITRVGYGSQEENGVISYPAVLRVDNDDLSLRPGMTGTAEITTLTRENALLAPNAALRFSPPEIDATEKDGGGGLARMLIPQRPRQARKVVTTDKGQARVWVLRDGRPEAVSVQAGASNGRFTEITGGDIKAGQQVITETSGEAP